VIGSRVAFIPELLLAAEAMYAGLAVLRPYFDSGEATYLGTVILGTVAGDIHDIGKNIVRMVLEGAGWKVTYLGADGYFAAPTDFARHLQSLV
jgi:5-methyltetrahydrofolate--homocysteine methyltransferase